MNLDDASFIKNNIKQVLTSTFPSTTTNATTTLLTGKYPIEHGWLGWSLYFEELNRAIDIYLARDSYTGEGIDSSYVSSRLPIEPYYKNTKTEYTINKVVPPYWHDGIKENKYDYYDVEEMFSLLDEVLHKDGKQFVYSYCGEPDATMHEHGVSSAEAKEIINHLDAKLENLVNSNPDSLFIITADHGQVDIDGYIDLYKDEGLYSLLEWPPYLEPRAAAFKVKSGYKQQFRKLFEEKYKEDFILYETEYLLKEGYFGNVEGKNSKLLGDYIGVCFTNKMMLFYENYNRFKGHHTSLTEEMEVPLIIVKGMKK